MANTYVLVHGAWHGGWSWRHVAKGLRDLGHKVTTVTQTGLGERKHLLSADITVNTFVEDVVQHLISEEIDDAILVGHSFGGISITGAADRAPDRIRHLVYLDSLILDNGDAPIDRMPRSWVEARRKLVDEDGGGICAPPPPVTALGMPADHPMADWVSRRMTPHPAGTYFSQLKLQNPFGNNLPRTYIACTSPYYEPVAWAQEWVRGQPGWDWLEIATGHEPMFTAPDETIAHLERIGEHFKVMNVIEN